MSVSSCSPATSCGCTPLIPPPVGTPYCCCPRCGDPTCDCTCAVIGSCTPPCNCDQVTRIPNQIVIRIPGCPPTLIVWTEPCSWVCEREKQVCPVDPSCPPPKSSCGCGGGGGHGKSLSTGGCGCGGSCGCSGGGGGGCGCKKKKCTKKNCTAPQTSGAACGSPG